jgi:hypothetical protein
MTEETPCNALGDPSPGRTDFTRWARQSLESFARQAADENLVLRTENERLKQDLATALAAWRKCATTRPHGVTPSDGGQR